jgi:predicted dehydrogenase
MSGDQKVRLGIVGVGDWGRNLLRNFARLKECQISFICDSDEKNLKKASVLFPYYEVSKDYQKAITQNSVDAVIVATPPDSHFQVAKEALLSGKHVFVEKPLVLDLAEGEELCRLASDKNKMIMVGHIMMYHAATRKLREYIQKGELGEVYYIYTQRVNLGKVRHNENALYSFAPHDISLVCYLLDKTPVKVSATGSSYIQDGIEDVVFVTLHFADRIMAHIHVSWLDPHKDRKVTIVGSKKMAVFDDTEASEKIWLYDKGVDSKFDYTTYGEYLSLRSGDILIPKIDSVEPLESECKHFVECVREGKQPLSDGKEGLKVLRVLQAAQKSLKSGGTPVEITN